jgi:hypothetical protein
MAEDNHFLETAFPQAALDCPTRGTVGTCPECGRMVPDTCGKSDPRKEVESAPEAPQEAAGEIEAPQATEVAEASEELTTEALTKPRTRKTASK